MYVVDYHVYDRAANTIKSIISIIFWKLIITPITMIVGQQNMHDSQIAWTLSNFVPTISTTGKQALIRLSFACVTQYACNCYVFSHVASISTYSGLWSWFYLITTVKSDYLSMCGHWLIDYNSVVEGWQIICCVCRGYSEYILFTLGKLKNLPGPRWESNRQPLRLLVPRLCQLSYEVKLNLECSDISELANQKVHKFDFPP